jgi:hypothetical protein
MTMSSTSIASPSIAAAGNYRDCRRPAEDKSRTLSEIIKGMLMEEIDSLVSFHTASDNQAEWNIRKSARPWRPSVILRFR